MAAELSGKVAIVTGGASGLGRATVELFLKEGARVVIADVDPDAGNELAHTLGDQAAFAQCDISNAEQVQAAVDLAVERFGRLDVLISNAGVLSPNGRIHNLGSADWERAFRVNVLGPVHGIRAAVPVMRAQRSGSIILTASVAGMTAWSHSSPYCVTKAGVIQLAKVAAVEYARDHIRVNCVCPGTFLSAMHAGLPAEAVDAIAAKHPLGLGQADDLVGAYSYLASDASRWTTGSAIVVDGGYAAP